MNSLFALIFAGLLSVTRAQLSCSPNCVFGQAGTWAGGRSEVRRNVVRVRVHSVRQSLGALLAQCLARICGAGRRDRGLWRVGYVHRSDHRRRVPSRVHLVQDIMVGRGQRHLRAERHGWNTH